MMYDLLESDKKGLSLFEVDGVDKVNLVKN